MKHPHIQKTFFITHVHWDREWYWSVEKYRFRLFEVFDAIKTCLERDDYHSFWFDGQMVCILDYLEARPQDEACIKKWVTEGKLHIGPLYVLNDEQLPCGEAQVRNYSIGMNIAARFGAVAHVGYMSDNFGHMSQTPQLLRGFNIDNAVFGRGHTINTDTEDLARWHGADGSEVLAVLLNRHYSSCAGLDLDDDASFERSLESIKILSQHCTSGQLLLMYGIDHALPNPDTANIIKKLGQLSGLEAITHSSFDEYLKAVRSSAPTSALSGELMDIPHLDGTFSSRIWQKALNRLAEKEILLYAEPLASIAEITTQKAYPQQDLLRAWKYLLRAHLHDSLPGCHADRVSDDMRTRLLRAHDIASFIAEQSTDSIHGQRIDYLNPSDCRYITAYNPLPYARHEIIRAELFFPADTHGLHSIQLKGVDGKIYPVIVLNSRTRHWPQRSNYKIPKQIPHTRVLIECGPVHLPAMGFTSFEILHGSALEYGDILMGAITQSTPTATQKSTVSPTESPPTVQSPATAIHTAPGVLENEYISVTIHNDARIDICNKISGHMFKNIHHFEAEQDEGTLYYFSPLEKATVYYPQAKKTHLQYNSPTSACYVVETEIEAPAEYSDHSTTPQATAVIQLRSFFTLHTGEKFLRVRTEIHNTAKDICIRSCFQTQLIKAHNISHTPFDLLERPPLQNPLSIRQRVDINRYVASEFTSVSNGTNGLAIINNGLPEYCFYEHGHINLTILRSSNFSRWGAAEDNPVSAFPTVEFDSAHGGQCLGDNSAEYALFPFGGNISDEDNMDVAFSYGATIRCRPAVNPINSSGIHITQRQIRMTGFKKSEDGSAYILRLVNLSPMDLCTDITFPWTIASAQKVKLDETVLTPLKTLHAPTSLQILVKSKEIISLRLTFYNRV